MNTARYTRFVAAAQAALAAGFKSAAGQQEAVELVSRSYSEVRDAIGSLLCDMQARDEDWNAAYDAAPYSLAHWKDRARTVLLNYNGETAPLVAMIAPLVDLRAAIKAAPVVKPVSKKAAVAAKVAAIKEAVAAGVASPICLAIAPLRAEAVAYARQWSTETVAAAKATLTAAGFDLDVVAPLAGRGASKHQREMADATRDHYYRFLTRARNSDVYTWDEEGAQRFIADKVRQTEQDFDSFVLKLDEKVGAHTAAKLISGETWSYSILSVTLADGTVQRWMTQRIVNCSVLGNLFNQWPTRLIK